MSSPQALASQLRGGEQIQFRGNHHVGMWELKANLTRNGDEVLSRGPATRRARGDYQTPEHVDAGRRGGSNRSDAKREAARRNFAKATHVRCH